MRERAETSGALRLGGRCECERGGFVQLLLFLPQSQSGCHRVKGDLKVTVAVLHEDVGDSTNGRIRYVFTFFFPRFLASSFVLCCAPCLCRFLSSGKISHHRSGRRIRVSHSQHSSRHRFSSTPIQVESSSGRH